MTTPQEALTIAVATYAADSWLSDLTVTGLWEDSEDFMVSIRYPGDVVRLGEGPLMISKADGSTWWLCSADVGKRVSGMTEVAP